MLDDDDTTMGTGDGGADGGAGSGDGGADGRGASPVPRVPPTAARAPATAAQTVRPSPVPKVPPTAARRAVAGARGAWTCRKTPALARCVACSAQVFAEASTGAARRGCRARPTCRRASRTCSPSAAVDELVSERGLRTPFLRMAKDGAVQPPASFTRGGGAGAGITDQAADDKVLSALADGSTLVLQGLHRMWPPLVDFGSRLADELGHPVQINAYITPAAEPGLRAAPRRPRRVRPAGVRTQALDRPPTGRQTTR